MVATSGPAGVSVQDGRKDGNRYRCFSVTGGLHKSSWPKGSISADEFPFKEARRLAVPGFGQFLKPRHPECTGPRLGLTF